MKWKIAVSSSIQINFQALNSFKTVFLVNLLAKVRFFITKNAVNLKKMIKMQACYLN